MNAFDELRFGAQRTLNLREGLPVAAEAVRRAERWLREHQVKGSAEVLVITGRGSHSPGGIGVIRQEVERLLFALRRRGVVAGHEEHNPGAFVVRLAPIRAMVDAIPRRKDPVARASAPALHGLSPQAMALLRQLAELSLDTLGVTPDEPAVEDEVHRQLRAIAPALRGGPNMEDELRAALRKAIAEYD
jgi:hypothetical protein